MSMNNCCEKCDNDRQVMRLAIAMPYCINKSCSCHSPQSVNDWERTAEKINDSLWYVNPQEVYKALNQARTLALQEAMEVVKERITDLQILVGSEDTRHFMHDAQMKLDEAEGILSALTSLAKE